MVWRRAVNLEVGVNLLVDIRSNNESWGSIKKADYDISSVSSSDTCLSEDDPFIVGIP